MMKEAFIEQYVQHPVEWDCNNLCGVSQPAAIEVICSSGVSKYTKVG